MYPCYLARLCDFRGSPTQLTTSLFLTPQARPPGRLPWHDLISFPLVTWLLPSSQPSPGAHLCPPQGTPFPRVQLSTS